MTPRAEELLSYMIGLAPIGRAVVLDRHHLAADLGIMTRQSKANLILELVRAGVIRRGGPNLYQVIKRIGAVQQRALVDEEAPAKHRRQAQEHAINAARHDAYARLAEIPRDTRSPAQRLMGEPIFERSALAHHAGKNPAQETRG